MNLTTFAVTLSLFLLVKVGAVAQVGIGTTNPESSSILDISSSTKGLLMPRMTTAERGAITTPVNGLIVYDTDQSSFYYYDSSAWVNTSNASITRNNHKIIKSESDLASELTAGGGSKILLSSNTLYEINGTVSLSYPIELNNAYLVGKDTYDDILVRIGGVLFTGTTGGTIKGVTLSAPGGTIFSLTAASTENLIVRDLIISNSGSVGTISGFGLVFKSVIQYSGNSTGIVYSNITDLLLSNIGWFANNSGVYETFTGTFNFIEKQGGFSKANGAVVALDVSSNPNVAIGALTGTSFSGTSANYVNKYTVGSFSGYNFSKEWTINCPGIPKESDAEATGYYNMSGNTTTTSFAAVNTPAKIAGTTTAANLFRMEASNNRLTYKGSKPRHFEIICTSTVDHTSGGNRIFSYYIYKNGVQLSAISAERRFPNNDIGNFTLIGSVFMNVDDYVEVWAENQTNGVSTLLTKLSVVMK